jgi:XrtN system VIT domain protein
MKDVIARLKDKMYLTGLILIAISCFVFYLPLFSNIPADTASGLFVINFAFTAGYFIALCASGRLRRGGEGLIPLFLLLILFLISAFSLNRDITIFEETVPWFAVLLGGLCLNYVLFKFFEMFPWWLQQTMVALLGISVAVFTYMSFYLAPLYIVSGVLFFVLGISLHTFVPLLFLIYTIKLMNRIARANRKRWLSFAGGVLAVLVFVIVFVVQWSQATRAINITYGKAGVTESNGMPGWIAVAQHTPHGWITERALKTELVYSSASNVDNWDNFLWRMPSRNFGETIKHDPLVMVATFFVGKPYLEKEDRIKILESLYDARHQAQERLWNGDDLFTDHITTAVRIWPQFGLSYTEKTITVTNAAINRGWRNEQEGIYTFHLPEGGVITALSLWIEGNEAKGILTTKEKADSAYKTIVGVESRDPSVVHWQEGNTVSVRVFPVTAGQSRKFKLGITAPLIKQTGKLVYGNIWFDGPVMNKATEDVQLDFQQAPKDLITPVVFSSKGGQSYKRSGKYQPDWKIQLNEQPLSTDAFCFDGKTYTVHPYHPQRVVTDFNTVYLDINRSWSRSEFEMVYDLVKDKQVFVYHNGLLALTPENKETLFEQLQETQFSLFPIFEIRDPARALLISKNPSSSPNLADLKDSRYMEQLKTYLAGKPRLRLFNIGHQLSPYLKSLKEYRIFSYEQGELSQLKELLDKKVFAQSMENDGQVVIDDAGIMLLQKEGTVPSTAPDHLMRLFSYNHIMQKTGSRLLTSQPVEDEVVQEAAKAYVVSPVSSLVVLETQKDYDRFDITASKNSLQNASLKSKGAVPEPHEWALIIMAVLVILTIKFRPAFHKSRI